MMKKELNYIKTAFSAEWLKINGLGLKWFGIIIAVLAPVLIFFIKIFSKDSRIYDKEMISISQLSIQDFLSSYGGFLMIVFIIIAATRIAQTDHKNNGWTFLETQPLSKLSIYSGKFLALALLSFVSIAIFFLAALIFGYLTLALFPQENINFSFDTLFVFQSFVRLFALSLGIISLQMMLSIIIPGFVWPFVIGFLGFVINIVGKIRGETYDYVPYNNLDTGLSISNSSTLNHFFNYTEYLSVFWAILFFIIGYFWYSKRGFKNAFLKNNKVILASILTILVFVGLYFGITKPIYSEKNKNFTNIEGKIISKDKLNKIIIVSRELGEKIAEIPVKNGSFQWETKNEIPLGEYIMDINGKKYLFVFSKGDHLIFDIKIDPKNFVVNQKGTRKAESYYLATKGDGNTYFYNYIVDNKEFTNEPDQFYKAAQKEWQDKEKAIKNYRTTENIYFADDFRKFQLQTNAIKMLNAVQNYQRITSFSDKKFSPPADFQKDLENNIKYLSPLTLTSDDFKTWKLKTLLPKQGTKNPDSIIFSKLSLMPASEEKDRLLSFQLLKTMNLVKDENQRNEIFLKKVSEFKSPNFKNYVAQQLQVINNQQKGKPFPALIFQNEEGKTVNLSQFKGKYVVIDFWATWCAPCKETSPVFEFQAKQFRRQANVVFLSASIDEDKNKWKLDIKNKKSNVINWWIVNQNALQLLGVNGIPRFMMIDPEGKIYNANMPRPNETNFEDILDEVSSTKTFDITF